MIYFTSDLHFGHKNILKFSGRPFVDINHHDHSLKNNNNEMVSDSDEIYDFGDVGYRCPPKYIAEMLRTMNGKRTIILGNHDKSLRQAYKQGLLKDMLKSGKLEIVGGESVIYDNTLIVSKILRVQGKMILMSHYSYRTWPSAFKGSIMLHGHSHGNLPELQQVKNFDVGVDLWNYYPVSLDRILKKCKIIDAQKQSGFEDGDPDTRKQISDRNLKI